MLRLVIAGGGTGGHVFPGIALADEVRRRFASARVVFLGTDRGLEARVVERAGYELETVAVSAIRGTTMPARLAALVALPGALLAARSIIRGIEPELVVGVGGYASVPGALAAYTLRLPLVLLEQNARPGLANRLLGRLADRVCVSFPETVAAFPAGVAVHTGNPVRFRAPVPRVAGEGFGILVFGGSAGARRLNLEFPAAMEALGAKAKRFSILHQTGRRDREQVEETYRRLGLAARVVDFIEDMACAYAGADLVVCRAGATTVAELTAIGRPALLVPYPFAADRHQEHNARSLVRAGAARMLLEEELTATRLAREIEELSRDRGLLAKMADCALRAGTPHAATCVLEECLLVADRRRRSR